LVQQAIGSVALAGALKKKKQVLFEEHEARSTGKQEAEANACNWYLSFAAWIASQATLAC
jgi:hypothetical protein